MLACLQAVYYITIYNLIGQYYYTHMYIQTCNYMLVREYQPPTITSPSFQKRHHLVSWSLDAFLLLTCITFSNVLLLMHMLLPWFGTMLHSGTWFRSLWLWHLIIVTLSTTKWMHKSQLFWDISLSLVLTIWLSNIGSIPYSFILIPLSQQDHISITILSFWWYGTHGLINYANATLPFVVTAFPVL